MPENLVISKKSSTFAAGNSKLFGIWKHYLGETMRC